MYSIKCENHNRAYEVCGALYSYLGLSRFSAEFSVVGKRKPRVVVRNVRLLTKKGYCGNHAGPCRNTGKKHRKMNYLEGLDWVFFNDMVNDALDSIQHCGDVESSVCKIRKGICRRMLYYGTPGGKFDRDGIGCYCCCFQEHHQKNLLPTAYEPGTPGIIGWHKDAKEMPYDD